MSNHFDPPQKKRKKLGLEKLGLGWLAPHKNGLGAEDKLSKQGTVLGTILGTWKTLLQRLERRREQIAEIPWPVSSALKFSHNKWMK